MLVLTPASRPYFGVAKFRNGFEATIAKGGHIVLDKVQISQTTENMFDSLESTNSDWIDGVSYCGRLKKMALFIIK